MKKLGLILVLILVGVLLYKSYMYWRSSVQINHELNSGLIQTGLLDEYYVKKGEYPSELYQSDSLYEFIYNNRTQLDDELQAVEKRFLIDPFSKEGDYYYYLPIYSRQNGLREGFKLLSAGLDGKIDNKMKNDSIFEDDKIELNLYEGIVFNPIDLFLGKKDYLIYSGNGIAKMKESIYEDIRQDSVKSYLSEITGIFKNQSILFDGVVEKDTVITGDRYVFLSNYGTPIKCKIYKGENLLLKAGEKVDLIGICHGLTKSDSIGLVQFVNCVNP